jgi:hypothetical protein
MLEDYAFVSRELTEQHEAKPFSVLISGAATGADTLAVRWARAWNVPVVEYPAQWERLGRMAGPVRNRKMLEEGRPDFVIAFPGGRGTAHMVQIARASGVPVLEVLRDS